MRGDRHPWEERAVVLLLRELLFCPCEMVRVGVLWNRAVFVLDPGVRHVLRRHVDDLHFCYVGARLKYTRMLGSECECES